MKMSVYKSGLLLVAAAALLSLPITAQEVMKELHKEFRADNNTTLNLDNRYGNIVITAWDNNQVVIDVKIKVDVPGTDRANKLLGMIDVVFQEGTNSISARTVISDNFNFSGWSGNKSFSINYTVKMPYTTALALTNRYGNTDIDELRGHVSLNIKYGNLSAGKLTRGNVKPINNLVLAYGKGTIDEAGWLDINVRYSGSLEIPKSQALLVDSRYSTLRVGETSSIVGESKYDKIDVEMINNLVLLTGYTTTSIGELTKKLNVSGSYGSLSVESVPKDFESLEVDVRYMGVRLGISENATYRLEGSTSYGGIKYNEENFKFEKRIIENTSSEISGIIGKDANPSSTVKVESAYASVKLY
jgi:hypothetical protein